MLQQCVHRYDEESAHQAQHEGEGCGYRPLIHEGHQSHQTAHQDPDAKYFGCLLQRNHARRQCGPGDNAYGWLKSESGVHRLVRISPYDSAARRHTSFSSIGVYPVIDDRIVVDVQDKDLKVDTYRASGAGGQHVNRTDSAVRITHLPTGIVVQCQNDRSQHRNRATAMEMLKARIYEQELQKREAATLAQHEAKTDIGWGHQIRSYVLQPYQMVKDIRTEVESGNVAAVLDGDLDSFMEGFLRWRRGQAE